MLKHRNLFEKGNKIYTKNIYVITAKIANGFMIKKIANDNKSI